MALSGLHVACCYSGAIGPRDSEMPVIGSPVWSQTMASPATSTQSAGDVGNPITPARAGQAVFRVVASADSWVAIGPSPDASQTTSTTSNNARHFVPALTLCDFAVQSGDKLAWTTA